MKVEQTANS